MLFFLLLSVTSFAVEVKQPNLDTSASLSLKWRCFTRHKHGCLPKAPRLSWIISFSDLCPQPASPILARPVQILMLCSYLLHGWAHIHVWLFCFSAALLPVFRKNNGPLNSSLVDHTSSLSPPTTAPLSPLRLRCLDFQIIPGNKHQLQTHSSLQLLHLFFLICRNKNSPFSLFVEGSSLSAEFLLFSPPTSAAWTQQVSGSPDFAPTRPWREKQCLPTRSGFQGNMSPPYSPRFSPSQPAEEWIHPVLLNIAGTSYILREVRDIQVLVLNSDSLLSRWDHLPGWEIRVFLIGDKDGASLEGFPAHSLSAIQREEEHNSSANGNLQGFLLLSILQLFFFFFNVWFQIIKPTVPTGLPKTDIFILNKDNSG